MPRSLAALALSVSALAGGCGDLLRTPPCDDDGVIRARLILEEDRIVTEYLEWGTYEHEDDELLVCYAATLVTVRHMAHFDAIAHLTDIDLFEVSSLDYDGVIALDGVELLGGLQVDDGASVGEIRGGDQITTLGGITLLGGGAGTISGFAGVTEVPGHLLLNANIGRFEALPNVRSIAGQVYGREMRDFTGLGSAEEIGLSLSLTASDFEALHFPALRTVGQDFIVQGNLQLNTWDLPSVSAVDGDVLIIGNSALSQSTLESWVSGVEVGGDVSIYANLE